MVIHGNGASQNAELTITEQYSPNPFPKIYAGDDDTALLVPCALLRRVHVTPRPLPFRLDCLPMLILHGSTSLLWIPLLTSAGRKEHCPEQGKHKGQLNSQWHHHFSASAGFSWPSIQE